MNRTAPILAGTLLALSLVFPLVSSAVVNDDESTGVATSGIQCPSPALTLTLSRGQRDANTGGQVSALQGFLADYFNLPDNFPTGYFGLQTEGYVKKFQGHNGIEQVGFVGRLTRAAILKACSGGTPTPTAGITITAPNGGEQWEEGVTNTVTWTPYQYNPDINPSKDVTAYLETSNGYGGFTTLGKVQESGKASIHWVAGELNSLTQGGVYASPGKGYYIRVVNNVTGASDRSDAPFTLLQKPIDLKINGSDGPITATAGVPLTVSWTGKGHYCRLDNAYDMANPTVYPIPAFDKLPTSGTRTIYVPAQQNWYVNIGCLQTDGTTLYDAVVVNASSAPASLTITSPNGGEQIDPNGTLTTSFRYSGLKSYSIALYKNDQWKFWIAKDNSLAGNNTQRHDWQVPKDAIPSLGSGDNAGAIFKIYITGQKADGTGYVDDKSDAPFSFTNSSISCVAPKITLPYPLPGYAIGISPGQNGTGQIFAADQTVTYSLINSPSWVTISGDRATFGTVPTIPGTYNFTVVATNGCGAKDTETIPVVISSGSATINQNSLNSTSGTPTISGTSTDVGAVSIAVSSVSGDKVYGSGQIGVNGGTWSATIAPALPSGSYKVSIYNYYSNVFLTSGTLTVSASNAPAPTCSISTSKSVVTLNEPFTISWTSTNADYVVTKYGDKDNAKATAKVSSATAGTYEYPVKFYGASGTVTCTARVTVVSSNPVLTATPESGTAPLWVNFDVSGYTPKGDEIVDFGDGSKSALGYTTSTNSRHDYTTPGNYTARLLRGTQILATATVNVTAPAPTTAGPVTKVYQAERDLYHIMGRADADGWSAATTASDSEGHMVYGPYASDWGAGSVDATFRMMVDNNSVDNWPVVTIDIYDSTAGELLAIQDINRTSFSRTMAYQDFTISASLAGREGHAIEVRVYWHGGSYVRVDQVSVKITPAVARSFRSTLIAGVAGAVEGLSHLLGF